MNDQKFAEFCHERKIVRGRTGTCDLKAYLSARMAWDHQQEIINDLEAKISEFKGSFHRLMN